MNKLVEIKTRSEFDKLNKNDYLRSVVFIEDTKEIWTHGTFYTGSIYIQKTYQINLSTAWTKLLTLDDLKSAGTYIVQVKYGGVYYSGVFSFSKYEGNTTKFIEEEIPLHASGNSSFNGTNEQYARIFLKIGLHSQKESLFISASTSQSEAIIELKVKLML